MDACICLEKLWLWLIVEKYLVANKQLPTSLTSTSLWYKSLFGSLHDEVHHDRIMYHNNKINFFHIHMIYFCADYKKWTCLCGNILYCIDVLITYSTLFISTLCSTYMLMHFVAQVVLYIAIRAYNKCRRMMYIRSSCNFTFNCILTRDVFFCKIAVFDVSI